MTINLEIDPQVLAAAADLAEATGRTVGAVVSDLARKGLEQDQVSAAQASRVTQIDRRNGLPVFAIDPPAKQIDPEVVRRELEENGF